jgi:nucleoid DNA-binding protein
LLKAAANILTLLRNARIYAENCAFGNNYQQAQRKGDTIMAKKPAKKAKAKAPAPKAVKKPMTKAAMLEEIASKADLTKKQVAAVFDELGVVIERHIKKGSTGQFTLPGLMKIEVRKKPATKARKGISPFTGEEMMFKAKPARKVVKIRPLKRLKDMLD